MYELSSLLDLIGLIALIWGIVAWVRGRHKNVDTLKYKILTASGAVLLVVGGLLMTTTPQFKAQEAKNSASSKATSSRYAASTNKAKLDELKLGMTKKEVLKIAGKPAAKTKQTWVYKKGDVYFSDGRTVSGGDLGTLQKQVMQSGSESKAAASSKSNILIGFAQAFGRKPTDSIAKLPAVYKSTQVDDDTTMYSWTKGSNGVADMIRIDKNVERTTQVYLYDESAKDGLGKLLYTGRTIFQKSSVNVY